VDPLLWVLGEPREVSKGTARGIDAGGEREKSGGNGSRKRLLWVFTHEKQSDGEGLRERKASQKLRQISGVLFKIKGGKFTC